MLGLLISGLGNVSQGLGPLSWGLGHDMSVCLCVSVFLRSGPAPRPPSPSSSAAPLSAECAREVSEICINNLLDRNIALCLRLKYLEYLFRIGDSFRI